jgi:hypothetical protein
MADDFSDFTIAGLEGLSDLNFGNINFNWDFSGLGEFFSDPHNWDREMAALNAGMNASPLLAMSSEDQIDYFKRYYEGDPEILAQDAESARIIEEAQKKAREDYNKFHNITTAITPTPVGSPYYEGMCAGRRRMQAYSDGSVKDLGPAPDTTSYGCRDDGGDYSGGFNTSLIDPPPAVTPTPIKPTVPPPPPPPPPKTAPIDTILFDDESVPIEIMTDLIFEDIGGHELINIARNDTINGQTVSYQPIKNLTAIQQQYNPNNIVSLQNTSDRYFANFAIKLETKLPGEGDGGGPNGSYVYIDTDTGDLIVELINLDPDEQIEVQISLSGTIYEAEFNES